MPCRYGVDPSLSLKYNKHYVGLSRGGIPDNFVVLYPRKQHVIAGFRIARDDALDAQLEEAGVDLIDYGVYATELGRARSLVTV